MQMKIEVKDLNKFMKKNQVKTITDDSDAADGRGKGKI